LSLSGQTPIGDTGKRQVNLPKTPRKWQSEAIMESGVPFGDIIVFGAIAAFIILRYRAMLGENKGRDMEQMHKRAKPDMDAEADSSRVIHLPNSKKRKPVEEASVSYAPDIEAGLKEIVARDGQFDAEDFLQGAKSAFEMVLTAFNEKDRETLQMLLSKKLYENFDAVLKEQEKTGKFAQTTLVALLQSDIVFAGVKRDIATIKIAFKSEQIQIVRDDKDDIIEGDVSHQQVVEDSWHFTRDMRKNTPNWEISET
jgi:predicted lipid-binding transport protein (Tim44 family)